MGWETRFQNNDPSYLEPRISNAESSLAEKAQQTDLSKLSINALFPPSGLSPAVCDGVTDDTANLQAMINYLQSNGGGKLELPGGKTALCNLTINNSYITLQGQGSGTVLRPKDLTKPVLSVGNTSTQIYKISLKGLRLNGDSLTTTSDGLVIDGITYLSADDFQVVGFGGDNVRVTSTGTQPSQYINFSNFSTKLALGSCLNLNYGSKWVTAIYFTSAYIEGGTASGSTAVNLTGIVHGAFANSYIQCGGSKLGHIIFNTDGAKLIGQNLSIDVNGGSSSVVIEIKSAKHLTNSYLWGTIGINGYIQYSDATQIAGSNIGDNLAYHSLLSYPIASNGIIFGDGNLNPDAIESSTESNTMLMKNLGAALFLYPNGSSGSNGVIFYGSAGTPASSTATGKRGQMMWDATYVYFCTSPNAWIRVPITTGW